MIVGMPPKAVPSTVTITSALTPFRRLYGLPRRRVAAPAGADW